ncbi:carboxyltransferase domain-containing protein [Bradyrhizobium sp. RDT10]
MLTQAAPSPTTTPTYPRFLDAGETALVVEFGDVVDPAINDRVMMLDAAMRAYPPEGAREFVPTYGSLMIHYDPLQTERNELIGRLRRAMATFATRSTASARWILPCCYDPEMGEDLDEAAKLLKLKRDDIAAIHTMATFRI